MKAPMLALIVATVACGASSIYFWQQLAEERARADQVIEQSRKLNARIVELERARMDFGQRRFAAAGGPMVGGAMAQGGPPGPLPPGESKDAKEEGRGMFWGGPGADPSPAFQKMMRNQVRAGTRRMYAGLGDRLGLNKEQANKLTDLLADQQMRAFDLRNIERDGGDLRQINQDTRERNQAEIADLIGADKAESLQKYQESLPARMELDMISAQLEGAGTNLSEDQSKRMLDMMVEERARVPEPRFSQGSSDEDFTKSLMDWQTDYNERVAAQAHNILNNDQAAAYDEYQQLQAEIRQQFTSMPGGGPRRFRADPAGSVSFTTVGVIGGVATPASAPKPANKKAN